MSEPHWLTIKQQDGACELDEEGCRKDLAEPIRELFEQWEKEAGPKYSGQGMFRATAKGKLQAFDGGPSEEAPTWEWGKAVNVWGYGGRWVLAMLARNLRKGKVVFEDSGGGEGTLLWVVEKGKVRKAVIS